MRCALFLLVGLSLVAAGVVAAGPPAPDIHAYYFTAPLCPSCTRAHNLLKQMVGADPQVKVHVVNVFLPDQYELAEALLTVAGIPGRDLPVGPALLVGHTFVDRGQFTRETVQSALAAYRTTGAPDLFAQALPLKGHARQTLPLQYRRFGMLPFVLAGLLDGINPCAFATLVFLLSYLGMMGTRGRSLAGLWLAFALGVFLAYFAFGVLLLQALYLLDALPLVHRVLLAAMGAVCLGFACQSWRDHRALQRGDTRAVKLQLPLALKQQSHALIRRGVRAGLIYPASVLLGAAVSCLELACTGQVYVPALIYMMSVPGLRASGMTWLLAYDLMFVLPLLVLLALVLRGLSSQRLRALAEAQAARTKLALAVFFVLCAAYFILKATGLL